MRWATIILSIINWSLNPEAWALYLGFCIAGILNSWFDSWMCLRLQIWAEQVTLPSLLFSLSFNSHLFCSSSQPFPHFFLVHVVLGYLLHSRMMCGPNRDLRGGGIACVWLRCPCMLDEIPAAGKWKPLPRTAANQQQGVCDCMLVQGNPNTEHSAAKVKCLHSTGLVARCNVQSSAQTRLSKTSNLVQQV